MTRIPTTQLGSEGRPLAAGLVALAAGLVALVVVSTGCGGGTMTTVEAGPPRVHALPPVTVTTTVTGPAAPAAVEAGRDREPVQEQQHPAPPREKPGKPERPITPEKRDRHADRKHNPEHG